MDPNNPEGIQFLTSDLPNPIHQIIFNLKTRQAFSQQHHYLCQGTGKIMLTNRLTSLNYKAFFLDWIYCILFLNYCSHICCGKNIKYISRLPPPHPKFLNSRAIVEAGLKLTEKKILDDYSYTFYRVILSILTSAYLLIWCHEQWHTWIN